MLLGGQEELEQASDGQAVATDSGRPVGVQIDLLVQLLLQGTVGVTPGPKLDQPTSNLLGPLSVAVGEEWKARVGLLGLVDPRISDNLGDDRHPFGLGVGTGDASMITDFPKASTRLQSVRKAPLAQLDRASVYGTEG